MYSVRQCLSQKIKSLPSALADGLLKGYLNWLQPKFKLCKAKATLGYIINKLFKKIQLKKCSRYATLLELTKRPSYRVTSSSVAYRDAFKFLKKRLFGQSPIKTSYTILSLKLFTLCNTLLP